MLNGCTISPLLIPPDITSLPSTWYVKISPKFGRPNKVATSIPSSAINASKASLVGANTVYVPNGFVNAGINSAVITAVANVENPLSIAIARNRALKSVRPTLLIRRDGNELYIESTASPIRNDQGDVSGGVLVFHDVSESRELNRRLSYHASHDILTGLVNRREFEARIDRSLKSARARETSYALLYLDLDRFKIINDTCGHQAGDTLLGQLGALLKARIRWRDCLSRLGGDEFAVLLES